MSGRDVFVGVMEEEAIKIFDHDGSFVDYLAAPGAIGYPCDLEVDKKANYLCALDCLRGNVQVYDLGNRSLLGTIADGALLSPTGMTLDAETRQVFVSDYGSSTEPASVRVFSYAEESWGAELEALSGAGDCDMFGCTGGFSRPRAPAVHKGVIYVPDVIYGQVLMYDRESHACIGALGSPDPPNRDLRIPTDVAINALGDVYVVSSYTGEIVVFWGGAHESPPALSDD